MFTLPAAVVAYAALGAVVIAEVVAYAALVSNAMTGRTSTLLAEIAKARKHLVHKVCTTFSSLTDNFGFLATKETKYCYTQNARQSNKQSSHACGNSVYGRVYYTLIVQPWRKHRLTAPQKSENTQQGV